MMKIANNVLREALKNVYFICGTAYSGKTTIAKNLADSYNMTVYHVDHHFEKYRVNSTPKDQPAFCKKFESWEEFFSREPKIYSKWLNDSIRESVDFAIVDLLKVSNDRKIIVEGMFPVELIKEIALPNQSVFLIADYDLLRKGFFNRKDKMDLYECIMSQKNHSKLLENVLNAVTYDYYSSLDKLKECELSYIVRSKDTNHDFFTKEVIKVLGL